MKQRLKYFIFNKPYNVLSQFTREAGNESLADYFILDLKDVYPIGRLDKDSEGLLILTNDKSLNDLVLHPKNHKTKTYLAQVEGDFTKDAIFELKKGVSISIDKKEFLAKAVDVKKVVEPKYLWERNPPVRFRKEIPTSWVEIKIQEGKNRQVRKMFAAVDFPVLRLIRTAIENLDLDRILPGDLQELSQQEMFRKLQIK